MPSEIKSETARANGAKSRGPGTPEGRARSSRNSLCHGFTAKSVVLAYESSEDFQSLLDSYANHFDPQSGVEMDLVQAMATARWRLRRLSAVETTLFSNEMLRRSEDIDAEFTGTNGDERLAWVFQTLAHEGDSLTLLMRYEGALNRAYDRAFKQLHMLQSARPPTQQGSQSCPPPAPQPNEPKPPAPVTPKAVTPVPARDLLSSDPPASAPLSPPSSPPR